MGKTEFLCFEQDIVTSTWNEKTLKLVDHFLYLGSNISSTESDIKMHIMKSMDCYRQVTDHMKTNRIKQEFLQAVAILAPFNGTIGENGRWEGHKNATCFFVKILEAPHPKKKPSWITPLSPFASTHHYWPTSHDLHSSDVCGHWMPSRGSNDNNEWIGRILRNGQRNIRNNHD